MRTFIAILGLAAAGVHGNSIGQRDCDEDAICTEVYHPVCAEGVTYSNPCRAESCGFMRGNWTLGQCVRTPAPTPSDPNIYPPPASCLTPGGLRVPLGETVSDVGDACTFYTCENNELMMAIIDCAANMVGCEHGDPNPAVEGECCPTCPPPPCDTEGCPAAICLSGSEFTPEGACCPSCRPERPRPCDEIACAMVMCEEGFAEVTLLGQCCPTCRSTRNATPPPTVVSTTSVECGGLTCPRGVECDGRMCNRMLNRTCAGGIDYNNPCHALSCGFVEEDISIGVCNTVPCDEIGCAMLVACERGFAEVTLPGQCCPSCRPVGTGPCDGVRCAMLVVCEEGLDEVTPEGECCPRCRPVGPGPCDSVRCAAVECEAGFAEVSLPGQCCPSCRLVGPGPCDSVRCAAVACEEGLEEATPEGECCPRCRPVGPGPCDGIRCAAATCEAGFAEVTLPGQCCPSCRLVRPGPRDVASVVRQGDNLVVKAADGGIIRLVGDVHVGMEGLDLLAVIRRQQTEIAAQRAQLERQQRQISRILNLLPGTPGNDDE